MDLGRLEATVKSCQEEYVNKLKSETIVLGIFISGEFNDADFLKKKVAEMTRHCLMRYVISADEKKESIARNKLLGKLAPFPF